MKNKGVLSTVLLVLMMTTLTGCTPAEEGVAKAYGVLRAMGLYAARHTIYIGADGTILHIDRDVNTGSDVAARLEALGVSKTTE